MSFNWLLQVYISYIDLLPPLVDRKKSLREQYYFDCTCDACTDRHMVSCITALNVVYRAWESHITLLYMWHMHWLAHDKFLGHRSRRLQWPIVITRCPASVRPSSVVCPSSLRQFTFSTSSPEPLDGFWWNLVWMKYLRSLTSVVVFRPDLPRGGSRAGPK